MTFSKTFLSFEKILKFFVLPLIGILIPFASNLFIDKKNDILFLSYTYCILISFIIWFGCRSIYVWLRFSHSNEYSYARFLLLYSLLCIAYSFAISFSGFTLWFRIIQPTEGKTLLLSVVSVFIAVLLSAVYEIVVLYDQNTQKMAENEILKKAKLATEIANLKSKIEPHFLFNSLSTLQNLIIEDRPAANEFNRVLSELYYDVITTSERNYLRLDKELALMYKYYYLINIRHPDAVHLSVNIFEFNLESFHLPPFSLQILLENAIKHNSFSKKNPLIIEVAITKNQISFRNEKNKTIQQLNSSKTGLKILSERFKILINKEPVIEDTTTHFEVKLPLKKKKHESLDY